MRCAAIAFSCWVIAAFPTPGRGQTWPLEPTAVLGVKLGVPIRDSGLLRCNTVEARADEPCLEKAGGLAEAPAKYDILRHPFPYAEFTAIVDESGVVSQILVLLGQSKFSEFAAVLAERYGPPSSSAVVQWQNRAGGRFPSRELNWVGQSVRIIAMERGHAIDRSVVAIQDIPSTDRASKKEGEQRKGAASKL